MTITERLYYDDSYTLTFDARVIERLTWHDHPAVVLDRSYFYPEGGGQLPDLGTLSSIRVIDVQTRDSDRAVIHVLESLINAEIVSGAIDSERRRDLRLHHSGQHILSAALIQAANAPTVSVHMSLDSMTIDVNHAPLSTDEILAVESLANRVVQDDLAVRCYFPDADALAALKLRKLPDVSGKVRVVDIGGFDVTACGGTHVARTGAIGLIKIVKVEKRSGGARVEFKCGDRALADYRAKNDVIAALAADLSVGYTDLPDAVARLHEEIRVLRTELKPLREAAIESEARALLAATLETNGLRVVVAAFEGRDTESIKALATHLVAQPGTVALLGLAGDKAQLIFAAADGLTVNVVPALKAALKWLGTDRGGGRPNFAQGGGIAADRATIMAALEEARSLLPT